MNKVTLTKLSVRNQPCWQYTDRDSKTHAIHEPKNSFYTMQLSCHPVRFEYNQLQLGSERDKYTI